MWISPAFAQDAAGGGESGLIAFLPIILIFVVFYFLLIRPQQKKMKDHKTMVAAVRRGDKVVTGGGLIGTVTKVVSDTEVQVELAQGVKVRAVKGTLSDVVTKGEPAKQAAGGGAKKGAAKPANDDAASKGPFSPVEALSKFLRGGKDK
jgi:preprotein translocase subunit YajC